MPCLLGIVLPALTALCFWCTGASAGPAQPHLPPTALGMADPLSGYAYTGGMPPAQVHPAPRARLTPEPSLAATPTPAQTPKTFYEERKRGWHWYEDPPPPAEDEAPEIPPQQPPEASPARLPPNIDDYSMEDLWNMHPDDFQALLLEFVKEAVRDPTEKNVTASMTMVDIARRKAAAYAQASVFVARSNPVFNQMNQAVPVNPIGRKAIIQARSQSIEENLQRHRGNYGLVYFYSPTCAYCSAFEPILLRFQERIGFDVRMVNTLQNPGLAARLGVTTTPSLILITRQTNQYFPVAVGVVTMDEITQNTFQAIRYVEGQTQPETFGLYPFQEGGPLDPRSILQNSPVEAYRRRQQQPTAPLPSVLQ